MKVRLRTVTIEAMAAAIQMMMTLGTAIAAIVTRVMRPMGV